MNWIERSIAAISPQWAYKRMAWRSGMDALYDSASRGRANTNWNPSQTHDENRMRTEREVIRARARDLERNSDIAESIISAFERNVIGAGMVLQSKVPEDEVLSEQIEGLWREFCEAENCDLTGTQSFEEIQEMMVRRYVVDGGIFVVKVNTSDKRFPFKLQLREVDELDTIVTSKNGKRIVDGIELDAYNRPVAYHFKKYNGNLQVYGETVRVPADQAIYWRRKTTPRQIREISMLATALNRIKDANQFLEAVSIKERVLACLAVFIKKSTPQNVGRVVNGGQSANYDSMSLSPGMIGELNPGDEVQTVIPSGQASNTKEFIMTLLRLIGSGLGLSYETIARDMSNVNYSSARQAIIEDRKTFKRMQRSLIRTVLTPIYKEFLLSMSLTEQLKAPDFMSNRKKYETHVWIPPGQAWIDPLKEVNANKVAIETNQDTLARIAAERGEDWREVLKQRAKEMQYLNELKIGGEAGAGNATTTADDDAA